MRTSKAPSRAAPCSTNVVSDRFVSRAIACISAVVRRSAPWTTASGLPCKGASANTSSTS
jgi:hypothetical protein